jgi:hypothetical protein
MRKSKLASILTKEMLKYEYEQLGSLQKMANKLQVDVKSISKYMKLYNIPYVPHNQRTYLCNDNIFSVENEKAFYLAGFIAADGSLQKRQYSKILKITLSKTDFQHLEKIRDLMDSNNPIKEYIVPPSELIPTEQRCVEIQIVSKQIFDDLAKFNIVPNKTDIYKFPKWLIDHPLVNHFMRGYFDGDGCISRCGLGEGRTVIQKSISMLGTKSFIRTFRDVLAKNSKLSLAKMYIHNDSVWAFRYTGNGNAKKIYDFLYKDATVYLDRKRDKFLA